MTVEIEASFAERQRHILKEFCLKHGLQHSRNCRETSAGIWQCSKLCTIRLATVALANGEGLPL